MKNYQRIKHSGNASLLFRATGVLLLITLLSACVLANPSSYASNSETSNVSVIVNSACTITSGGGSYAKTVAPGTTETIAGNGINVTCNDNSGYDLYAVGFTNDSYDTTNNNNTKLISTNGAYYIPAGTSGDSYWSMKAVGSSSISTTPTIDNGYSSFKNIPSTYTRISYYTASTIGTTSNSVTTPSYQVHVSSSQPASTYTGKVKYTLVHPHDVDTGANTNMQNWTGCSSLAIGSQTFLKDTRDGKFYNIVKYNDGKCWMTTNLDLAGGTALSSTDTDFDSSYTLPTTNGWRVEDGKLIMPASDNSSISFSIPNYAYVYNSDNAPTSDSGCTTPGCYSYYSWDTATLGSGRDISTDNTDAPYSICPKGWHLPNTRTGTDDTSDFRKLMVILGGSASISVYTSTTSPTGNTIFNSLSGSPFYFLRSGLYASGSFLYGSSNGYWWSSTSAGDTGARSLYFASGEISSIGGGTRRYGFPIRCLTE